MNIEDLVRQTQTHLAGQVAAEDRIRSALPVKVARAHRRRRLGMIGAVVVAVGAAAVTVPVLTAERPGPAPQIAAPASVAVTPRVEPGPAPLPEFRLGFAPSWVPSGFAEHIRSAFVGDPTGPILDRVWKKDVGPGDPWGGAELIFSIRTDVPDPAAVMNRDGRAVDIGGVRGYYGGLDDPKSSVSWSPGPHTWLMISAHQLAISEPDLLRMARSVKPVPGTLAAPLTLPRLPDGWAATGFSVSGARPATWRSEVFAGPEATGGEAGSLSVAVGTTTDAPKGGKKLTVAGHPARHPVRTDLAGQSLTYLVVDLGHGRLMTLIGEGSITLDNLVTVAEAAQISPTGLDWLGR
ncbi:hypothetical protein [Actinoplanes friuliensis]|uniref:Uncharacterized protein n=1 Tax=Actinoplanes friuliensis DSM 7358 TaxID=1246995 RepID=U5W558_9ACTN|nr:hypothetical protein [Actinoplanes friuliensis]AGZ43041.1 hypothetical protein AFR_23865 [Actinoplanes friuliensis DSM 7358]